jgi:exopolyphosphatase/guanosine-5'-triphosphate,3'-diphosphate pyrophosphatase
MRVAAIDLGTNTTRLLVGDVLDGRVDPLVRRSTITRLGEGVDARRRLLPFPIARVRNCLSDYRRELESLGAERALLVATSAVRDAENGEAFLGEIEWSYGFTTRLLSGEDEADLTRRGVGELDPGTVVVDVGGGSTELFSSRARVCTNLGSVRLTERFLGSDPPTARELRV